MDSFLRDVGVRCGFSNFEKAIGLSTRMTRGRACIKTPAGQLFVRVYSFSRVEIAEPTAQTSGVYQASVANRTPAFLGEKSKRTAGAFVG